MGHSAGGCCTPVPYESALAMLEVEGEVVGAMNTVDTSCTTYSRPTALAEIDAISKRLAHSFPWGPTSSIYLALAMRRRAGSAGAGPPGVISLIGPTVTKTTAKEAAANKRKILIKVR